MSCPGELHRLIRLFLDYELPATEEAATENAEYQGAAADFLDSATRASGLMFPGMTLQHILTKDIVIGQNQYR